MNHPLYIKNMVCDRCKSSVRNILEDLQISFKELELGEVTLENPLNQAQQSNLSHQLSIQGFELLEDRETQIINQIKSEVIRFVHHQPTSESQTLSAHLSVHLNKEYSSLSKLFSQVEGRTIESYYIDQRIEHVKELIIYDELSLSEIAYKLNYSSVAHLSGQFKKVTGMTPSAFKKLGPQGRKSLDSV
ncbi:DNA-binding domain-containing protein, AraC-type [Owenweeksia hongkongensis DSM 17368]|uniref:DNA-binding domain-containing protein, AraC-type n=1 Tax=Owenweeksia hongkongensis (strain DSM 17368 / CIP 108786 / JCM 12287 / NRRL B-23963 / UST20020801) TaxID=926562 RepID=G8R1W3_OWEHD|nr:AraC family transcriptional regulator [Owenweeksia hongkongensis]AEV33913.1 DNA-binding domain-containing protein, AraC-type [Owenweeksia hongkongensis DSM 17368]